MNLESAEALWWFGNLPASKLPEVACDLLEAGYDTETLRQIAGLDDPDRRNMKSLFEKALNELGRVPLSRDEAGLRLARELCQEIVSGRLTPYDGARRIWWDIWENQRSIDDLRVFVGLASQYEDDDDLAHQGRCSDEIMRWARDLLGAKS